MRTTWIVLAQRAGARIFARDSRHGQPVLQSEIVNAEVWSDKRDHDDGSHEHDKSGNVPQRPLGFFARELAAVLDDACGHAYDDLVLVAAPGFLHLLFGVLDRDTTHVVKAMIPKDLDAGSPMSFAVGGMQLS